MTGSSINPGRCPESGQHGTPARVVGADHWSLEAYRDYLRLLVRLQLSPRLHVKVNDSDIVQQAILQAPPARGLFRGTTEGEWLAWLRAILANALAAAVRRFDTQARGEPRTVPGGRAGAVVVAAGVPAGGRPSVPERTRRAWRRTAPPRPALSHLPDDQRHVVELHYLQGLSVSDVAAQTGRTRPAVAGLLFRGLNRLRALLRDQPEGDHDP